MSVMMLNVCDKLMTLGTAIRDGRPVSASFLVNSVRTLYEVRSNNYCELSAQGVTHNRLSSLSRPARVFSEERVRPDWLELIQQHPSRLMVGLDVCCGWFSWYSGMIDEIRTNLFPHLEPELIERLAYKNAVALFKLQ
jgi:hypothetical protein